MSTNSEQPNDQPAAIEAIREGLESMQHGDGTPARDFFAELRREFEIPEREDDASLAAPPQ